MSDETFLVDVEIDDEEFHKKLNEVIDKLLPEAIHAGMIQAVNYVESKAKDNVDDADQEWIYDDLDEMTSLKRNIIHSIRKKGDNYEGEIGVSNSSFGVWLHQGTGIEAVNGDGRKEVPWFWANAQGEQRSSSGKSPNPFLKNAVDDNKEKILICFENQLEE